VLLVSDICDKISRSAIPFFSILAPEGCRGTDFLHFTEELGVASILRFWASMLETAQRSLEPTLF
jgi:hypothetical protein